MIKYNLAKMLEEIRHDEHGGKGPLKKMLTQEEIKAMARRRRKPDTQTPPAK